MNQDSKFQENALFEFNKTVADLQLNLFKESKAA